jgi:pimeloyl-ACP methyl ester carboxylesterase
MTIQRHLISRTVAARVLDHPLTHETESRPNSLVIKNIIMKSFRTPALIRWTLGSAAWAVAVSLATAAPRGAASVERIAVMHQTAKTLYVDVSGSRIAYRRFGRRTGTPLVFLQHFAGTMDNWDPAIIDGFARNREVILFDNAGIAGSTGEVPGTIEGMAAVGVDFLTSLGIHQADLLGFSTGSLIAQEIALQHPALVRRLVLVGSAPRGGVGMATFTPEFQSFLAKKRDVPDELLLDALFTPSVTGQTAGREFLTRIRTRVTDRDVDVSASAAATQQLAIAAWGAPSTDSTAYLENIHQPTLLVDGSNDVVFYTVNAITLQHYLPNAQLIVYPDSNHAPQYRFPDRFLKQAGDFLSEAESAVP